MIGVGVKVGARVCVGSLIEVGVIVGVAVSVEYGVSVTPLTSTGAGIDWPLQAVKPIKNKMGTNPRIFMIFI
jgi:hypothetical protein